MKLLIDECLSEELVKLARDRGHAESSHVRWIGQGGAKDWQLMRVIVDGDWTFVTKNSVDFRGPREAPGSKGQYRAASPDAGLVCLNGPVGMDLRMQLESFDATLDELESDDDLINQAIEVTLDDPDAGKLQIVRYAFPPK